MTTMDTVNTTEIKPRMLSQEGIKEIQEKYNAKYIIDSCIPTINGNSNFPCAVFYSEVAHPKGSNFFCIFSNNGSMMIANAAFILEQSIQAIQALDGELIISRYRHDFVTSSDETVSIDGGREYTRILYSPELKDIPKQFTITVNENGVLNMEENR